MMFILSNALNSCIFLSTIISGLSISTIIVASCIWKPMHLKSKKELEIFIKNKPYHLNYLIPKFYEDSDNEKESDNEEKTQEKEKNESQTEISKSKASLIDKYIYEKTPNGYIIMNWNQDNNAFQYWSNNTIPYKILEVVARKYVLTFDCIELYIDKYYESQKKYNKLKNEINKNIELEKEKNANKNKDKKTNTDVFLTNKSEKKLKVAITNDDLVCEKANKYLKKGKINEFKFTIKKKAKIKNISFLDWETIKLSMGY